MQIRIDKNYTVSLTVAFLIYIYTYYFILYGIYYFKQCSPNVIEPLSLHTFTYTNISLSLQHENSYTDFMNHSHGT